LLYSITESIYLLCKLSADHIAIPDFAAGAMENWGLVTYLMRSLLYNPDESSVSDRQWVALVVAHELAHQVECITLVNFLGNNLVKSLLRLLFY